jgi:hypothetical protein
VVSLDAGSAGHIHFLLDILSLGKLAGFWSSAIYTHFEHIYDQKKNGRAVAKYIGDYFAGFKVDNRAFCDSLAGRIC